MINCIQSIKVKREIKPILMELLMLNEAFLGEGTDLKMEKISVPELVEGNKSPTLNGTGYIFYTISPVGEVFLKKECKRDKKVIEIGSGYSNIPLEALKNEVLEYTANDISKEHLQILVQRITENIGVGFLKNLTLIHGQAPFDLPKVDHEYDAILADKVIHFMLPHEIIQFIKWTKKALKKDGKIYVTAASPYSTLYRKMLPEYLQKLKEGREFPGHFKNVMNSIDKTVMQNYPKYTVPCEMILFSRRDLIELFQNNGMQVVDSYSLKIPTAIESEWKLVTDEESNVVGIIAKNEP